MKLYIDTTKTETITIKFDDRVYTTTSKKEKAQRLLPFIIEKLNDENINVGDITEVNVNTGPGSFTGIRIGVAIASTLGWVLGIPVNGKKLANGRMPDIKY
jgi:tRNA threonylcarbamoyl adenosine modification protein YeaZ